jgi:putative DNA primase/helicase
MQDLADDKFATSDLYRKLANVCGDLDSRAMKQAATLKQLTSNKDRIRAQKKNEHAFPFVNFAKLIFAANLLPTSKDDSTGFYRRFEIIPFMHVFKEDEWDQAFLDNLTSQAEISGLFNKVVGLLPDLIDRHSFTNQLGVYDVRTMYQNLSSPAESFCSRFVQEKPGEFTPKKDLWLYFNQYCQKLGVPELTMNRFGRYITANVEWIMRRAIQDNKDDHKSNYSTTINGQSVAAWPDTYFDLETFENWTKL